MQNQTYGQSTPKRGATPAQIAISAALTVVIGIGGYFGTSALLKGLSQEDGSNTTIGGNVSSSNDGTENGTGGTGDGNGSTGGNQPDASGGSDIRYVYAPPAVGEYIYFGDYDWQILDIQDGKALLLSNYIWERKAYHNEGAETIDDCEIVTWETCDLRAYLNGEFYDSFSADDRAKIVTVTNQNPDNPWLGMDGGADTQDNIFILSLDEVVKYLSHDVSEMQHQLQNWNPQATDEEFYTWIHDGHLGELARGTRHTDAGQYESSSNNWWLRSPGFDSAYGLLHEYCASFVGINGVVHVAGIYTTGTEAFWDEYRRTFVFDNRGGSGISVRPAMWITLDVSDGWDGGETPSYTDRGERGSTVYNIINSGSVAEKDGWIYYAEIMQPEGEHPYSTICKIRPDGSERTELISPYAAHGWTVEEDGRQISPGELRSFPPPLLTNINVVGDWVYFTLDNVTEIVYDEARQSWGSPEPRHNYICRVRTDGTGEGGLFFRKGDTSLHIRGGYHYVEHAAHTSGILDTITVVGDWIYYIKATESGEGNGLYKVRTDGTQDTLIARGDAIWRVSVVGDWIYYMLKGEAYRVRADGAQRTKVAFNYTVEGYYEKREDYPNPPDYFWISDMIIDGGHIYLFSRGGGSGYFDNASDSYVYEQFGWYRFDMDLRNGVRLDVSGISNISDGWMYHVTDEYDPDIGGAYTYCIYKTRIDPMETVMMDRWSSPNRNSESVLLKGGLSRTEHIFIAGEWVYCNSNGTIWRMRTDGTDVQVILLNDYGQLPWES